MPNLNKCLIMGHLTRNPEIRYTQKGVQFADFGMAVNRTWKDESGQKQEETTFVDVTVWSRLAEIAEKFLKKGSPVFIEGRLHLDEWNDKQTNQKRPKLKVIAESIQFLGARTEPQASTPPTRGSGAPRTNTPGAATSPDEEPQDIPF
jgi:single-strand DNA-binding protein